MTDISSSNPPAKEPARQKRPETLKCVRTVFVLESDDGRLWIAVEPDRHPTDGVMPHLVVDDDVDVTGATDDGGLAVLVKGDGHSVLDALYTAYPVAAPLVPDAFKPPAVVATTG